MWCIFVSQAKISKRMEEYLEAMYMLYVKKRVIRLKDLAKILRIRPASIVNYLDRLNEEGFVEYRKREYIKLTEKGFRYAREIYKRHVLIRKFLQILLDIPEDIADLDACYIEHGLHKETLDRIIKFVEFVAGCPKGFPRWLEHLRYYYTHGEYPEECREEGESD